MVLRVGGRALRYLLNEDRERGLTFQSQSDEKEKNENMLKPVLHVAMSRTT